MTHHRTRLQLKAISALTVNKKRLEYIVNKKCYYQLFRVYRAWKRQAGVARIARIAQFNKGIKGVITAYYAIVQNWQDSVERTRQCEGYRDNRIRAKAMRAMRVNAMVERGRKMLLNRKIRRCFRALQENYYQEKHWDSQLQTYAEM